MASFLIHLLGQHQPISLELPFDEVDALTVEACRTKFIVGNLNTADEDGVYRRVMIATSRIVCAIEL